MFDDILLWFSKCGEIERSTAPSRLQAAPEAPLHAFSSVVVTFGVEGAVEAALSMRSKRLNPSLFVTQACMDAYRWVRVHARGRTCPCPCQCVCLRVCVSCCPGEPAHPDPPPHRRSARPEPAALQQEVDKRMAAFEAREAAAAAAKEAADGKEDDDGFILVTKKAKDKPFESDNRKLKRKKQEQEQGGAGMQLAPFYRFQLRESKRNRECWVVCCATPSPPPLTSLVLHLPSPCPFPPLAPRVLWVVSLHTRNCGLDCHCCRCAVPCVRG